VAHPSSPLRDAATAYGRDAEGVCEPAPETASPSAAGEPAFGSPARYLWAMLLARLFESLPLTCPHCGADMRILAFITEAAPVQRILNPIGEPAKPPRIAPARGPPMWEASDDGLADAVPDCDALAQPQLEYVFDQQVQW